MVEFIKGNLFDSPAVALVNPVNCVGTMGAGLAQKFRERFPAVYDEYLRECRAGCIHVGKVQVCDAGYASRPRYVINFPTKKHWRRPSRLPWILHGMESLALTVIMMNIPSVAVPALGCGNGGLKWEAVRPLIEAAARIVEHTHWYVYEPMEGL